MSKITIKGKDITNAEHVSFALSGGGNQPEPTVTCTFSVPADEKIELVNWMLAKQSPDRYMKVVIETNDQDGVMNKKWTLHKCYIASYAETEGGMGHVSTCQVTLVGVLAAGNTYDGANLLKVEAGQKVRHEGS